MKLFRVILPFFGTLCLAQSQPLNPLTITRTSVDQFRLDWFATDQHRFQMEGSPDLVNWIKIGPVITGMGMSQTMLVAKTSPKYFYKVSEGKARTGFDGIAMGRWDDHTYPEYTNPGIQGVALPVNLGFTINFFGVLYNQCYVNNNGNISFGNRYSSYTPEPLLDLGIKIIAPFWADVDTTAVGSNVVRFTSGGETIDGHSAFGVTYKNVGYYREKFDKLNSFQVILIERSETGSGNFDIEFNYEKILWEAGDSSGGSSGISGPGGSPARAGITDGRTYSVELGGSGSPSSFLDSKLSPDGHKIGLIYRSYKSNCPGRFVFSVRDGVVSDSFVVSAGPDQTVSASHSASFQLAGSIDPPTFPGLTYKWTQIDGLPTASFSNTEILNPVVTIMEPGNYKFQLTATSTDSNTISRRATVNISHPAIFHVYAGDDTYLEAPASTTQTLHGEAEFSGGGPLLISWTQTYGDPATISNSSILEPTVVLPGPGEYEFMLTVSTSHDSPFTQTSRVIMNYY